MAAHLLGSALQGPGAGAGDCSKCGWWGSHPVEVVEGGPELIHLLLADALGISGQDLILHFVDGPGDGGEELLPAHTDMLGGGDEEPVSKGAPGLGLCRSQLLVPPILKRPKQSNPDRQPDLQHHQDKDNTPGQRTQMMKGEAKEGAGLHLRQQRPELTA